MKWTRVRQKVLATAVPTATAVGVGVAGLGPPVAPATGAPGDSKPAGATAFAEAPTEGAVVVTTGTPGTTTAGTPGTVVAVENLPTAAALPDAGAERRVTYLTTDHRGGIRSSTGAVHVPEGAPPPGGWPVVSYAHGTVGLADQCAPSQVGGTAQEAEFVSRWLRRGYAVVATDYAGLGTPGELAYLDGRAAAHNVIDMVRAARAAAPELASRWVAVGHSQGGHAALHTGRVATAYAPDLDYRGAVALGAPTNLDRLFALGRPGIPRLGVSGLTKFSLFTMAGMRDARPELDIDSYLSPRGRDLARRATEVCSVEFNRYVGAASVGDLLARPVDGLAPAMSDYLGVPADGYDRPLFLGQGGSDLVVPAPLAIAFVGQLGAAGTAHTFRVYPGVDHMGTLTAAFDDAAEFVDRAMG
ncbi:alpha/beta hydrolase family protein [Rhodococcus sp. NPDC003318]|uniref:alpha/beta hydrolase family protein n=1 Tax=Rhodococcus sp. NPDC003318 TaxID=3364503 RepID=UPI0036B245EF